MQARVKVAPCTLTTSTMSTTGRGRKGRTGLGCGRSRRVGREDGGRGGDLVEKGGGGECKEGDVEEEEG